MCVNQRNGTFTFFDKSVNFTKRYESRSFLFFKLRRV